MQADCYAGVMSGTSLDGVDAVVADFSPAGGGVCATLGAVHVPFPPALHDELSALQKSGYDEIVRGARAANALADIYAQAIAEAIADARLEVSDVVAAGVHGQTVRHRPDEGFSVQINNAARVAERSGVTVVADFRSRDVAAGGQGAPLVPAFHRALFGDDRTHRLIVNIGGIANITDLPPGGAGRGFDTGPGNALIDLWHARHRGGACDFEGAWARSGRVDRALLANLVADPYFALAPPKSTGRDLFNAGWLDAALQGSSLSARDVQATLTALTAHTIAAAVRAHAPRATEVIVAGGGAHNATLVEMLAAELAPRTLRTSTALGVDVEHVEALAFAWLARRALARETGNLPAATGARGPRVLGAIHWGHPRDVPASNLRSNR
ncbi:MAG: anhydro-N-acetylmuramic acid kinase [Casimicrobiaceae bacterium]